MLEELKLLTEEMIAQQQQFNAMFDICADMLCIASLDGYFIKVNQAWTSTLGYTELELLSKPFITMVHPDDIQATEKEMAKLKKGLSVEKFCNRYKDIKGKYKWLEWKARIYNQIIYASARDITERKEQIQKYNIAFQKCPIGMAIINTDGRFTDINQSFCDIMKYSKTELKKMSVLEITHPDDLELSRSYQNKIINQEIEAYKISKRYITKDKENICVDVSVYPILDSNNQVSYLLSHIIF